MQTAYRTLLNYKPGTEKSNQKEEIVLETATPFGEMLLEMYHPDVNEFNYQKYPFDTQEHFIEYYGDDCYDWNKDGCSISESFICTGKRNYANFIYSFRKR